MSRPDAERALNIYKTFSRQTDRLIEYLTLARQYEHLTRLEVPRIKHAPTSLTVSLEEYLNDPDFEIHRRQYLAQSQDTKGASKPAFKSGKSSTPFDKGKKSDSSFPAPEKPAVQAPVESKGPAPDLIDFFDSIEQHQQPIAQPNVASQPFANGYPQAQQYQQAGFVQQPTGYNPFLQPQQQAAVNLQPFPQQQQPQLQQAQQQQSQFPQQSQQFQPLQADFTGAGFGGYTPQPQQQLPQQQPAQYNYQFSLSTIPQNGMASFDQQQQQQQQPQYQQPPPQMQSQPTSTNPFRQSMMPTGPSTASTISSSSPSTYQPTNSFAKTIHPQITSTFPSSSSHPQPQTQQHELQQTSAFFLSPTTSPSPNPPPTTHLPLLPSQKTGTNPFARNRTSPAINSTPIDLQQQPPPPPPPVAALLSTPTGNTNPFRQSQFVSTQHAGIGGWQNSQAQAQAQGTFAGYDVNRVDTVPVFPRGGGG